MKSKETLLIKLKELKKRPDLSRIKSDYLQHDKAKKFLKRNKEKEEAYIAHYKSFF